MKINKFVLEHEPKTVQCVTPMCMYVWRRAIKIDRPLASIQNREELMLNLDACCVVTVTSQHVLFRFNRFLLEIDSRNKMKSFQLKFALQYLNT